MQIIFPSSVKRMLIKAAVSPWDHVEILQLEAGSGWHALNSLQFRVSCSSTDCMGFILKLCYFVNCKELMSIAVSDL